LKIAIFADSFLPGTGGTENVVLRLGRELSKEHEVMVFAPNYHRPFDDNQFPFKVVRAKSIGFTDNDFWALPSLTKECKRALEEFKPDVVHSHTQGMMADFANKYAKKHGIPSISTAHTKYKYCFVSAIWVPFIVNIMVKRVVRRAKNSDRVCAVSQSMIDEMRSYGLKKEMTVVRNGHDYLGLKKAVKTFEKPFTLLYVGLIVDFKNIKFSLKVLEEVKKTRSDFLFYVVGDGPHKKSYEKYAKKIGLGDNVIFTGRITDRKKLYEIYSQADSMFFTSIFDTDGLVLLEAAEAGTPSLVIKDTGASERYEDNVTGFFAENDKVKVAQRILELMDKRELVAEVGSRADSVFVGWDEIARQYVDIYKEEIAKKKGE